MAALEAAPIQGAGRDLCRRAAMPKIMADPRLDPATLPMPFDGKRMICGGFEVVVDT